MNRATLTAIAALVLAGCASNPDRIDAQYVSPAKYQDYDCGQLAQEMDYVGQRTRSLYNRLKKERTADNWQMATGMLLFWPALFLLEGGDGPDAAEYAQLKGDFEALRRVSVDKRCGIESRSPEEIMKSESERGEAEGEGGDAGEVR